MRAKKGDLVAAGKYATMQGVFPLTKDIADTDCGYSYMGPFGECHSVVEYEEDWGRVLAPSKPVIPLGVEEK